MKHSFRTLRVERMEGRIALSAAPFSVSVGLPSSVVSPSSALVSGAYRTQAIIVTGSHGTENGIISINHPGTPVASSGSALPTSPLVMSGFNPQPDPPKWLGR